jgi:ubiquinone/menaquinone biosynthesis C-methylase UbiE
MSGRSASVSGAWGNRLFGATVGALYNWSIQSPVATDLHLRATVGERAHNFLGVMDVVAEMSDNAAVLDVPCGGGITLRRLHAGQKTRYVAADIAPAMLTRARRRVPPHCEALVEFVECDITQMPFADSEFDLAVCFSGLHCLPDPAAAVLEIARCLRPGGRFVADVALRGKLRRTDAFMAFGRVSGMFGPAATLNDARSWLNRAGLEIGSEHEAGALVYFDCSKAQEE